MWSVVNEFGHDFIFYEQTLLISWKLCEKSVYVCVSVRLLLNMISDEIGESACNHQNDRLKINFCFCSSAKPQNDKQISDYTYILEAIYTDIHLLSISWSEIRM